MKRVVFCFLIIVSINAIMASKSMCGQKSSEFTSSENKGLKSETGEKMITDSNLKKAKEYQTLLDEFKKSKYVVIEGKPAIDSKMVRKVDQTNLTLNEVEKMNEIEEMKIIDNALNATKGKISVSEGAKVIIQSFENQQVVVFENKLPEGTLGSDYSAKVVIDLKSGEVLDVFVGN